MSWIWKGNNIKRKDKRIKLILVIPYITKRIDDLYREKRYDEIIFPDLGNVHYKAAIQKRNYWMVDNSDYLLAYVKNREGGARKSFEYAKRRGKKIVRLWIHQHKTNTSPFAQIKKFWAV